MPDEDGWRERMKAVHDTLQAAAGPTHSPLAVSSDLALAEFKSSGQEGLDALLAALDPHSPIAPAGSAEEGLTKVVLARRSDVIFQGSLDPACLLEALQERDPRAYQLLLRLPSGATFLGSTPEQLYTRTGLAVASEAVAGTRPRGPPGDSC